MGKIAEINKYETLREDEPDADLRLPPAAFRIWPLRAVDPFPDVLDVPVSVLTRWLNSLRIFPDPRQNKCTFWHSPSNFELRLNVSDDARFLYLEEGGGWVRFSEDTKAIRWQAGDALLVPPDCEHHFKADAGSAITFFNVHFSAQILGGLDPLTLLGFPRHLPCIEGSPYAMLAHKMHREFRNKAPGWKEAVAHQLFDLLLYVMRHEGSRFNAPRATAHSRQMIRLLPALETIENRLGDSALDMAAVAASCAISQVYLRRLFHQTIGMSPSRFIQRRRIERASILLRDTTDTISFIAGRCGFVYLPSFYRAFKEWTNTTPSQYRQGNDISI